jgi:type I restriction enzyme, S subunit
MRAFGNRTTLVSLPFFFLDEDATKKYEQLVWSQSREAVKIPFSELLTEVIDNRGKTCPTAESGIPLIATNCIRNELLYPTYEKARFVSQKTYDTWFRGHPQPGDILFVNKATPGRVCLVPDPVDFCIAQDMVAVRADEKKVYPKFLFALLRSPAVQENIKQMHVGTLIPHFKKGDFDRLLLPIPDREAQKFIGDIYFMLSAKIELNRRMNETLETLARTLFKSWFIDPAAAKLPKDWRELPFAETVEIFGGGTPKTSVEEYWNGDILWFSVVDAPRDSDVFVIDTEKKISEAGIANSSTQVLPLGTTIISARGTVGKVALVGNPMAMNQSCYGLRGKIGKKGYYTFFATRALVSTLQQHAHGSVFDTITRDTLQRVQTALSPTAEIERFEDTISPLMERIRNNLFESRTLAELRDTLLPKLLSGELRVPVAEKLVKTTV